MQPINNRKEKKRNDYEMRLNGQERQPIRSKSKRALINEFYTVKNFLCRQRLGRKDLINVASRPERWKEVRPRARIENLVVTVLAGTGRVFQKMLSNSRVMCGDLRSATFLAGTGKIRAILKRTMVSYRPENMLLTAFLKTLGCTSYVHCSCNRWEHQNFKVAPKIYIYSMLLKL